jgi:uncharacterized protein (DUF2249 family)/quercetin dioxygenase-like cupin family protein
MRVTGPEEAPPRRPAGGEGLRVRVLAGDGPLAGAVAGMAEVEIAPGATLPAHDHGDAEALVYVIAGRARFACGDADAEVAGGGAVHLPRGAEVAVANAGADRLRLLAVFSPAGFEGRFLAWEPAPAGTGEPADRPRALLDLTQLPRPQRHRTVIAALEALDPGTRLVVVNDHEPDPLRRQLERRYDGRLGWDVSERSGDRVAVALWLDATASRAG